MQPGSGGCVQGASQGVDEREIGDEPEKLSAALYAAAIPLAFVREWIADAIYVLVALMWLVPDRRIESRLQD